MTGMYAWPFSAAGHSGLTVDAIFLFCVQKTVVCQAHAKNAGHAVLKPQQLLKFASRFQRPLNARFLDAFATNKRMDAHGATYRVRPRLD